MTTLHSHQMQEVLIRVENFEDCPFQDSPLFVLYSKITPALPGGRTGVEYFYNFMTREDATPGPVAVTASISQVMPGDVVQ